MMLQVEDVKAAFGKKLKVLEQQLEQEHEDRYFIQYLHQATSCEPRDQDRIPEREARAGGEDRQPAGHAGGQRRAGDLTTS